MEKKLNANFVYDYQVVSLEERIKQTPNSNGEWKNVLGLDGKRGQSLFYPSDDDESCTT